MNIVKPIGMEALCSKVGEVCANPYPYKFAGMKPPHFAVGLDKGNGRTTLLEYVSDMYRASGVIEFTGGVDDFLEVTFDGSLTQLKAETERVKDSGFYNNGKFKGVISVDAVEISKHQNETQAVEAERFIESINDYAAVILFYPTDMTLSEERYMSKLKGKLDNVIDFGGMTYTDKECADIVLRHITELGVNFELSDDGLTLLLKSVKELNVDTVESAVKFADGLILRADYLNGRLTVSDNQVRELCSGVSIRKGELIK